MDVVMFHSVGNHNSSWSQKWLSVSLEHFEEFCKFLKESHYHSIHLDEWYDMQNNPKPQKKNQVVLTFDDGYLDNWVYAYPILKKYNLKGTIFINPEFVDPSTLIRPNLEECWKKKVKINDLHSLGFLNWKEINEMQKSGIIDIESHSMSHNYYFSSNQIIDYYEGQNYYHWLAWLERPDQKPYWMTSYQKDYIPIGYPIFQFGRALGLKRFIPSQKFINAFIYKARGLLDQHKPNIIEELKIFTQNYQDHGGGTGHFETDLEMEKRFRHELFESKRILEEKLNKEVNFLCWPGGGYNNFSVALSKEAGYKASTISSMNKTGKMDNTEVYKRIQRFGLSSFETLNGVKKYNGNKKALIYKFRSKKGEIFFKFINKINKLLNGILVFKIPFAR